MKTIEDAMKYQYELLKKDSNVKEVHIDWHEGGHFSNTDERMVMGIKRLLL